MIDIIIPTNKSKKDLRLFLKNLKLSVDVTKFNIIATCFNVSAATNRNYGLVKSGLNNIVIMCDDDILNFYPGWAESLVKPLENKNVIMVSARLVNKDNTPAVMMNIKPDFSKKVIEVKERMLPSACIAFRNDGTKFDEAYEGAGFEDTDFCMQLNEKYPNGKFVIKNTVKLLHLNEMKNQLNGQLQKNKQYFEKKWVLPITSK